MMSVRLLAAALERSGGKSASYLAELGLSSARLGDVHARITLAEYKRAVSAALAASNDPALGLHMAEHADFGSYDVLGYLSSQSSCLGEALAIAQRYTRVVKDGPRMQLRETSEAAIVSIHMGGRDTAEVRLVSEFALLCLLNLVRHYVGKNAEPRSVLFRYAAPAYRGEYARLFAGREQFSQALTGLELPRAWLAQSRVCCSNELRTWLEARANQLLARSEQAVSTADRVRGWLDAHSDRTQPTMDEVAHDFGMSSRSLRRHLRLESVRFDELVEAELAERAKRMLGNPACSVQEVAYDMGFHTPSAFSRAFKRWTGAPPTAFRQQGGAASSTPAERL